MAPLTVRVRSTIRRHGLIAPADRVLVAISGGPDSVALALVLAELAAAGAGWTIAGLAHVHHGLRGADADADEAFCRTLAARLDVPIDVTRVDVAARARAAKRSIEAVARDARYAGLADAAARLGATCIATGHTLDDQAETVLLRLLRGAGMRGLSGIRVRRGAVVRPLLECRREQMRRFLARRGEAFRRDASNDDWAIARNRIRHDLLPVIDRIAPAGRRALARLAALASDLDGFLDQAVAEMVPRIVLSDEAGPVRLRAGELARLPPALARHLLVNLVGRTSPGVSLSGRHLEAIRTLAAADKDGGHLDLPGLVAERAGTTLTLGARARQIVQAASFEHQLEVPGSVSVPEAGVTISAACATVAAPFLQTWPPERAALQASSLAGPLVVRSRRPGDRLRPLGAPGRRKLQDVLVDRRVPRADRDRVPVVVDARGRIVWIAGVAMAEECRVTAPEAGMVILEMKQTCS
jgi:tRNA(Ile)-lysidine synthase